MLWFSVQNYDVTFQMRSLVNGAEAEVPMLILGPPGSGKSSIMAKIVDETCMRASKREIPGYNISSCQSYKFFHFDQNCLTSVC